ncbi:MAG: hypothetical protein QOG06_1796 [Gaiellaceae bacterium]|jgi:hypothetical protein|nr:hypothetical protein [Gaiellaceae bacterium]
MTNDRRERPGRLQQHGKRLRDGRVVVIEYEDSAGVFGRRSTPQAAPEFVEGQHQPSEGEAARSPAVGRDPVRARSERAPHVLLLTAVVVEATWVAALAYALYRLLGSA